MQVVDDLLHILYSGKHLREKTFVNFVVLWKFLCKIWERGVLWRSKSEQSAKVVFAKIVFFTNSRKFSPSKVSRYTVSNPPRIEHIVA